MALFNYASKEITLKVVYYGPGLSGKTTNLQRLHATMSPERKGKLLSLSTEADRTLFFDFLPVALGKIKDFTIRFQLYTVPGQVRYNATRKLVLKGADAVVFVADSQTAMREQNVESFRNMRENLVSNNINPDEIPVVLQYNKRDLKNILSSEELNSDLNAPGYPVVNGAAINGTGVDETFKLITKLLLTYISKKHNVTIDSAGEGESAAAPALAQRGEAVALVSPTREEDSLPAFAGAAQEEPPISWQDLMEPSGGAKPAMSAAEPAEAAPFGSSSLTHMLEPSGGFGGAAVSEAPAHEDRQAWPSPGPAEAYLETEAPAPEEPIKPTSPISGGAPARPVEAAMIPPVVTVPVLSEENMAGILGAIAEVTTSVREMASAVLQANAMNQPQAAPAFDESLTLAVRKSGDVSAKLMEQVLAELQESRKRQDVIVETLKRSEQALRAVAATVLEFKEKLKEAPPEKKGFRFFGR